MNDAAARMRGLQPEREPAIARAIERRAEGDEPVDRIGRGCRDAPNDQRLAQARAGLQRVDGVIIGPVVLAQGRGDAALRPAGRGLRAERSGDDKRHGQRGEAQRGRKAGDAAADDDDILRRVAHENALRA